MKKLILCFNCFGSHHVQQCISKNICRPADCGKKHHTTQCFMKTSLQKIKQYDPIQQLNRFNCKAQGKLHSYQFNCLTGRKRLSHAYLDNGSCQSLLLQFAALILGIDMNTFGKMPISGYHTTKEIDCSPKIKP